MYENKTEKIIACPKCGTEYDLNLTVCPQCGNMIPPEFVYGQALAGDKRIENRRKNVNAKSMIQWLIMTVLAAVCLVAIVLLVVFRGYFWKNHSEQEQVNSDNEATIETVYLETSFENEEE